MTRLYSEPPGLAVIWMGRIVLAPLIRQPVAIGSGQEWRARPAKGSLKRNQRGRFEC
jgi:hypothetical protein